MPVSAHTLSRRRGGRTTAFSLMEVTITLAVISFALVALLGMLPIALDSSRLCVNETRAAQLARMVFSTLASEPFGSAPCFTEGGEALDLSQLDGTSPPVLLYAGYDVRENARIVREETPPPEADYRIEMRFEPVLIPTATATEVRGTTVRLRISDQASGRILYFEGSEFLSRLQRIAITP